MTDARIDEEGLEVNFEVDEAQDFGPGGIEDALEESEDDHEEEQEEEEDDGEDEGGSSAGKKRKIASSASSSSSLAKEEKKRARLQALKISKKIGRQKLAAEAAAAAGLGDDGAGPAWLTMDREKHRDFFWRAFLAARPALSSLERVTPAPEAFWVAKDNCRIASSAKAMPDLLKSVLRKPKRQLAAAELQVLVLSASAVRSVELIKAAGQRRPGFPALRHPVARLFAKHIKVDEAVEALKEPHPVAVGTPNRVAKLFSLGALSPPSVVVFDMAPNAKGFHVLDQVETRRDIFELFEQFLVKDLREGKLKVCMA